MLVVCWNAASDRRYEAVGVSYTILLREALWCIRVVAGVIRWYALRIGWWLMLIGERRIDQ